MDKETIVKYRKFWNVLIVVFFAGALHGCATDGVSTDGKPESWSVYQGSYDGKVLFVRRNVGLESLIGTSIYPHRLGVAIPFHHPNEHGLPSREEAQLVGEIEDQLDAKLKETKTVFALVLTTAGMREFVFYTAEPEVAKSKVEAIRAQVKTHDVQYILSEDPQWSVYQSFRG